MSHKRPGRRVTITMTAPQAKAIHEALSMIEADTDWIDMLGGQREMNKVFKGHREIRRVLWPQQR